MANYVVTSYSVGPSPLAEVVTLLTEKINTIDSAKVIRLLTIISVARDRDLCLGVVIYDS